MIVKQIITISLPVLHKFGNIEDCIVYNGREIISVTNKIDGYEDKWIGWTDLESFIILRVDKIN